MNRIVKYKDLEWRVLKENDKEKLLMLKDSFTNELIRKYFTNENMVDSDCDVRFNKDYSNPWWRDSYIRQVLNTKFLEDLNIDDLYVMETTVELNNEKVTTRDYVRLLTKEEVKSLEKEELVTEREYGYWTMSPYHFYSSGYAYVFSVYGASNPGQLNYNIVNIAYGVRPVISLKSNVSVTELTDNIASTPDCDLIEEIKRNATNKELADKLNELIRDRNKRVESELKDSE